MLFELLSRVGGPSKSQTNVLSAHFLGVSLPTSTSHALPYLSRRNLRLKIPLPRLSSLFRRVSVLSGGDRIQRVGRGCVKCTCTQYMSCIAAGEQLRQDLTVLLIAQCATSEKFVNNV